METIKFKTNLKCGGCVRAITPGIEALNDIAEWKVDLESPDKTLEVTANSDVSEQVMEAVKKAGYLVSRLS